MWRFAPYALGALISAFVAGYWTGNEPSSAQAATFANRWLANSATQGKQDRLAVTDRVALRQPDRVQTIETIGDDHATVIYRDSRGAIVFRNDQDARKTVAMKNVFFPAVPDTTVRPKAPLPAVQKPLPAQHLMDGCEPALSPLASHEAAAFGGRCLASLGIAVQVASAR